MAWGLTDAWQVRVFRITMKRLYQGHLHPKLEVPGLTSPCRESNLSYFPLAFIVGSQQSPPPPVLSCIILLCPCGPQAIHIFTKVWGPQISFPHCWTYKICQICGPSANVASCRFAGPTSYAICGLADPMLNVVKKVFRLVCSLVKILRICDLRSYHIKLRIWDLKAHLKIKFICVFCDCGKNTWICGFGLWKKNLQSTASPSNSSGEDM